jgi:hypothetical protein
MEEGAIMKRATLFWLMLSLMMGVLNVPGMLSAEDYGRYDRRYERDDNWRERWRNTRDDRRDLEGSWYLGGHRDLRAEIALTRRGLEATNEHGHTTRLEITRSGNVHALDWEGGLRGNVRRDRIEWENGTTWMRQPVYRYLRLH